MKRRPSWAFLQLTVCFWPMCMLKDASCLCWNRAERDFFTNMSQHRSLRAAATSGAKRNVMKRFERVEILKKRGQWKEGDRVTGLRKTRPTA